MSRTRRRSPHSDWDFSSLNIPASGLLIDEVAVTATAAEMNQIAGGTAGTVAASKAIVPNSVKAIDTLGVTGALVSGGTGTAGAASTLTRLVVKKTGIANNTATDVITVTVPNANHAAAIRLTLLGSLGTGTDTFESSRAALGMVVLARQAGANVVATAIALTNAGIATVATGGTLTLAYAVSSIVGGVTAANTFTITVTLVVTGTITDHQVVVYAELLNSEVAGVTMAAA